MPNSTPLAQQVRNVLHVSMEVVGVVSSIAGILALAGQILSGIVKLQGIFDAYVEASRTIARFISALKSLLETVQEVQDLVQKLERASTFIAKSILLSLQTQLEDCSKDVLQWAKVASANRVGKAGSAFDIVFRKFLVALKKDSIDIIYKEIAAHQDSIAIKLAVIGRHLNIQHTTQLRMIESKIVEVRSASSANHQITADALQRLESQLTGKDADGSPCPSLRTLADQISDIHSILRSQSSVGSAASVSGLSLPGSRKGSAIFSGYASPERPSGASNTSSIGSRRTSQFGKASHLPVRRKSSLGLAKIDSQIMPRRSKASFQDLASPIAEHPGIPALSVNSEHTSLRGIVLEPHTHLRPSFNALESSKKLLDAAQGICPDSLLAYMDLVRIAETISLHTKLLTCIRRFQGADSLDLMETKEYQDIYVRLQSMRLELEQARQVCWREGLDMDDIEKALDSGYGQDNPPSGGDIEQEEKEEDMSDSFVLQRRLQKLQTEQSWTSRLDRTNAWLLQNLASSKEATALHRSFLPSSEVLDERQWARLVLKYWVLDAAAPAPGLRSPSTNAAMMNGQCHSVRVRLDMPPKGWESVTSQSDCEEVDEKCFEISSDSGWKRGTLWQQEVTITVTEVAALII